MSVKMIANYRERERERGIMNFFFGIFEDSYDFFF